MAEITLEAIQALLTKHMEDINTNVDKKVNGALKGWKERIEESVEDRVKTYSQPKEEQVQEKLSLQALQAQIESERKARQAAEAKNTQLKLQGDFQSHFAKHLGADSPHLKPYLKYYEDRLKLGDDGQAYLKMQRDGFEDVVPLEVGMKELLDTDLKHLVSAKTSHLPPTGPNALLRGSPVQSQQSHKQESNPIMSEMLTHILKQQ